jgi:hypothetical protein
LLGERDSARKKKRRQEREKKKRLNKWHVKKLKGTVEEVLRLGKKEFQKIAAKQTEAEELKKDRE